MREFSNADEGVGGCAVPSADVPWTVQALGKPEVHGLHNLDLK